MICVIFHPFAHKPPWTDLHQTWYWVVVIDVDVITIAIFFGDRLRDVDSVGVKNGGFPSTKPLAVNTLLARLRSE